MNKLTHTTSASALRDVLVGLKSNNGTLADSVQKHFELDGKPFGYGILRISQIIASVRSEIEYSGFDEVREMHLLNQLAPIRTLEIGTAYNQKVANISNTLLGPTTLNNLLTIDMAVSGKKQPSELENPEELIEQLESIRDELQNIGFPKPLMFALDKQITAALESIKYFNRYGPEVLTDCLAQLFDTFIVRSSTGVKDDDKIKTWKKNVLDFFGNAKRSLKWGEDVSDSVENIAKNFQEVSGLLENVIK